MKTSNKQALKKFLNIAFIVGTFVAVIFFAMRSGDTEQIKLALLTIDFKWLLAALGCFFVHAFSEGFIPYVFYRFQRVPIRLGASLNVGLIGMYYSSITPAATGGQPMQVYALKRHGVPAGVSSSALTVKFFCWQCALLLLGAVFWLCDPALVRANMLGGVWLLAFGFLVNGFTVFGVILLAINRNILRAIIIFLVNVAHKLRLVKDRARTASRLDAALGDFHASVEFLTKRPLQFVILFTLSLIQVMAMMSATFFVYRGLGLSGSPYISITTMSTMLYIAASFTPLPGASGAQEGGFYLFFGSFFPEHLIFPAMLVWRFVTYYMSILSGFTAVLYEGAHRKKILSNYGDKKLQDIKKRGFDEKTHSASPERHHDDAPAGAHGDQKSEATVAVPVHAAAGGSDTGD